MSVKRIALLAGSIAIILGLIIAIYLISQTKSAPAEPGDSAAETTADEAGAAAAEEEKTTAEAGPALAGTGVTFTKAKLPAEAQWQLDVRFPDWRGSINQNFAINNRISFYGYRGQGELYVAGEEDCGEFSIFINDRKIDAPGMTADDTFCVDISSLTRNGPNSLQVSGLSEGSVHICMPYPVVLEEEKSGNADGSGMTDAEKERIQGAGISPDAVALIDRIITADVANGFPSAQLAIVKDGRLIYENAWGNVRTYNENGEIVESAPVTADTLYDLASNTKMYSVNYALQYMLTNGQADLDAKIVDILGEGFADDTIEIAYEGYETVPLATNKEWKARLTIRDLLTHQSGFPAGPHYYNDRYDHASQDFNSDTGNVLYAGTAGDSTAREETLKMICRTPLMYEPGTQTLYSDVDYMVLCYCIEAMTGRPLDEYLREVFWEPMGLTHITYNPLQNGFSKDDCAATELMGNTRDGGMTYTGIRTKTIQGEVHDCNAYYCMAGVSGHAGLFANAADLAKLASVMLTGGYGERSYFSRDVLDLFTAPKSLSDPDYGLGWWRDADHSWDRYFGSVTSSRTFGHQGFTGTLTMIDPENDLVIVYLTNKIHSPILKGDETLSAWSGNYYTAGSLGFVPAILEIGMDPANGNGAAAAGAPYGSSTAAADNSVSQPDPEIWDSLISDMTADMRRKIAQEEIKDPEHPRMRALAALESVLAAG